MVISFSSEKLGQRDLLFACIVIAAINMLWPAFQFEYATHQGFATDFLASNWLVLISCSVAFFFMTKANNKAAIRLDWALLLGIILLTLWPMRHASTLAIAIVSIYIFIDLWKSKSKDAYLFAAASILFTISFSRLWSPLLLKIFAKYFEAFDVFLLGNLLGSKTVGNTISFVYEPEHTAFIAMPCTSFANLSAIFLLWLVISRLLKIESRPKIEVQTVLWLLLFAITINTIRISLMITTMDMYNLVHGPIGAGITSLILTLGAIAFAFWGAKRAT